MKIHLLLKSEIGKWRLETGERRLETGVDKNQRYIPHSKLLTPNTSLNMKPTQVTIKDLAKHLGISVATVSRALRDSSEISAETKRSVTELAKAWDYQPNQLAMNLVKSSTKTIGVIVPSLGYFFNTSTLNSIENAAIEKGYSILIAQSSESYDRELTNIQNLSRGQVDGFLISLSRETTDYEHFKRLQRKGIPIVFYDRICEEVEASKVVVDNETAAYEATKHLIEQGCQRIAFLAGPKNVLLSNLRINGYKKAQQEANIIFDEDLLRHGDYNTPNGTYLTHQLMDLPQPPDGMVVVSDRIALGVYLALKERNLQVSKDLAIVSFNNEPICELLSPRLSSVQQPTDEIGRRATHLLIKEIEDKSDNFVPETHVLETRLVIRESSLR